MKCLQLNPQQHEIELFANSVEAGKFADIQVRLGETRGTALLTAYEAKKIGDWFLQLSKAIEGKRAR
jgi:hypothetical protein